MRPIQDDPLFLAFKRDWEAEHTEPEQPDRSLYVIVYMAAALGGGVVTAACLVIGAWVGGLL